MASEKRYFPMAGRAFLAATSIAVLFCSSISISAHDGTPPAIVSATPSPTGLTPNGRDTLIITVTWTDDTGESHHVDIQIREMDNSTTHDLAISDAIWTSGSSSPSRTAWRSPSPIFMQPLVWVWIPLCGSPSRSRITLGSTVALTSWPGALAKSGDTTLSTRPLPAHCIDPSPLYDYGIMK